MRRLRRFDFSPGGQQQMSFGFLQTVPAVQPAAPEVEGAAVEEEQQPAKVDEDACEEVTAENLDVEAFLERLRDPAELTRECQQLLTGIGMAEVRERVNVLWNVRLRSTAGYASYPSWRIELNPRLAAFPGQVDRTLRHELAHLVAYHRAGRRRIEPHGDEWRRACADLGIPDEKVTHHLPLPRSQQTRRHTYQCQQCHIIVHRVRPFSRDTACLDCCKKYNRGQYDPRYRFVRVQAATPASGG
jgi:SprT protein